MHLEPAKQVPIVLRQNKIAHSTPALEKLCGLPKFRLIGLKGRILLVNKQVYKKAGMEGKPGESRDGQENLPERLYINIVLR